MTKVNAVVAVVMAGLMSFAARAGEMKALSGVINVNTASAEELMRLPGVGEGKARLILEARSRKPFATKEDLLAVKGIGEHWLAQWAPYLAFSGATTLKEGVLGQSAPSTQAQAGSPAPR